MTKMTLTLDSDPERAVGARSYVYSLLNDAFSFPKPEIAGSIISGNWLNEVSSMLRHLPFALPPGLADDGALAGGEADLTELQRAYIGLFDVGRGQPYCPLYEGYHRAGRMKLMEELVRFFEHFGVKHKPEEQPDYICIELQFMHYLAFKEAAALADKRPAAGLARAQEDFLSRHLARWLPKVRARLAARPDALPFYASLAGLADAFCESDLRWLRGCRENSDV